MESKLFIGLDNHYLLFSMNLKNLHMLEIEKNQIYNWKLQNLAENFDFLIFEN